MYNEFEQFEEWLPWYVNNTLNPSDRQKMDTFLAKHPEAMQQVQFWQRMSETMQRRAERVPSDIGLAKTLARIEQTQAQTQAQTTKLASARSNPSESWLHRLLGGNWMKPALAFSVAVIVGQSVLLVQQKTPEPLYRGSTPISTTTPAASDPAAKSAASARLGAEYVYLRVIFRPNATEGEIRLLLASENAWVAGGPGQSGEYYLRLSPDKVQSAEEAIRASGLVTEIAPVASVPASSL